jgi:hypothetical protein
MAAASVAAFRLDSSHHSAEIGFGHDLSIKDMYLLVNTTFLRVSLSEHSEAVFNERQFRVGKTTDVI